MQYDGSININTQVDEKGVNKGAKSITQQMSNVMKAVKGVGVALAKAFSVGAIAVFFTLFRSALNAIRENLATLFERAGMKGELEGLQARFAELQMAVANAFLPLIVAALPYIKLVISSMIQLLNKVAMFVAAWMGAKEALQIVEGSTKKAAKNTEKIRKDVQGALAAFDEINVLDTNKQVGFDFESPASVVTEMVPVTDSMIDQVNRIKEKIFEVWGAITQTWNNVSGEINKFLTWLNERLEKLGAWIRENPEKFLVLVAILGLVAGAFLALIAVVSLIIFVVTNFAAIMAVAQAAAFLFGVIMTVIFSPIGLVIAGILLLIGAIAALIIWWPILELAATKVWEAIQNAWANIAEWFQTHVIGPLQEKFEKVWKSIQGVWQSVAEWFTDNVTDPIRETFAEMLFNVASGFMSTFMGIKGFVTDIINSIIETINNAIAGITGAFNGLPETGLGAIVGGGNKGNNTLAPRSIPHLATGAVIPPNSEFAAILGDHKSQRELLGPEEMFRRIVREESGNNGGGEITVNIPVYLDSEKIYDGVKRVQTRRGKSLVKVGGNW